MKIAQRQKPYRPAPAGEPLQIQLPPNGLVLDLRSRPELLEVIAVMVDAIRRSDLAYCRSHSVEPVTEEDWATALQAGEDALEANQE